MRIFLSIFFCFLFLPFFAEAQSIDDSISSIYRDIYGSDIDVYMKVEKMPAYPGGMKELMKDINENIMTLMGNRQRNTRYFKYLSK